MYNNGYAMKSKLFVFLWKTCTSDLIGWYFKNVSFIKN